MISFAPFMCHAVEEHVQRLLGLVYRSRYARHVPSGSLKCLHHSRLCNRMSVLCTRSAFEANSLKLPERCIRNQCVWSAQKVFLKLQTRSAPSLKAFASLTTNVKSDTMPKSRGTRSRSHCARRVRTLEPQRSTPIPMHSRTPAQPSM